MKIVSTVEFPNTISPVPTSYSWSQTYLHLNSKTEECEIAKQIKSPSPSSHKWTDELSYMDDWNFDDPALTFPDPVQDLNFEEIEETPLINIGMLGQSGNIKNHQTPLISGRLGLTDDEILDLFTPHED